MEFQSLREYAITVKKTRNPISIQDYINYLDYLKGMYNIGNVNIETTRGLHLHFIISCVKLDFKSLYPAKYGWNVKAVPIFYKEGWIKYSEKDLKKNLELRKLLIPDDAEVYEPTDTEIEWVEECNKRYWEQNSEEAERIEQEERDNWLKERNEYMPKVRIIPTRI